MFILQGLDNVISAREFVGWYNGHPDFTRLPVDLSKVLVQPMLEPHLHTLSTSRHPADWPDSTEVTAAGRCMCGAAGFKNEHA